jgi:hypothetical protein
MQKIFMKINVKRGVLQIAQPNNKTTTTKHHCLTVMVYFARLERVMGIEPTLPAWKAGVLPLNYTRAFCCCP